MICATVGLTVLGGCVEPAPPPVMPPPVDFDTPPAISAPALSLLGYAHRLSQTTPSGREDAVNAARRQAKNAPGARSYAYLAIALGSPHQRLYTPDEAARYAQLSLKAKPSPWGPEARQFLEDCVRLYTALNENSDTDKRIADLRNQLHKAQNKLKALSNVETHLDKVENNP